MTPPTPKVLLVDDDAALRELLGAFLLARDVDLSMVSHADDLTRVVAQRRPALIVLDLMMPGVDGLEALRRLRAAGDHTPVIFLTARAEGVDRVIGLELGADDYLGKPFMPQELLSRIHAVLRRGARAHVPVASRIAPYRFGRFEMDFDTQTLTQDGVALRITSSEFGLLRALVSHPMETLARSRLLTLWHGTHADVTERGIDVPIWRLRRLLETDPGQPRIVRTIRGIGYMFVPPKDAAGVADAAADATDPTDPTAATNAAAAEADTGGSHPAAHADAGRDYAGRLDV